MTSPPPQVPIANAFVYSASATFWIEWVRNPGSAADACCITGQGSHAGRSASSSRTGTHSTYLQLQYSQLVILIFNGVLWPHVTVATMTLSAG